MVNIAQNKTTERSVMSKKTKSFLGSCSYSEAHIESMSFLICIDKRLASPKQALLIKATKQKQTSKENAKYNKNVSKENHCQAEEKYKLG